MDLGRASFGGWELGPPSASEMAPDLETSPATSQIPQYPALQYLHKTAQYAEWGSYNICACPPYLCTYNHMFGAGGFGGRADKSSNGFGSLLCPSAGYGSTLCTWRWTPIFQNISFSRIVAIEENVKVSLSFVRIHMLHEIDSLRTWAPVILW